MKKLLFILLFLCIFYIMCVEEKEENDLCMQILKYIVECQEDCTQYDCYRRCNIVWCDDIEYYNCSSRTYCE